MQSKRGELVPVAIALADLPGPVQAPHDATPPARRGFTVADQVNQLVGASEADPETGFMARLLALCSLPRTNPGNRKEYKRVNGPYTLYMNAVGGCKLPFGNLPRLLLAWVCTEAVRTQSRELVLGRSLSKFMRTLGINSTSGGVRGEQTRLRNQMKRLFGCTVSLLYQDEHGEAAVNSVRGIHLTGPIRACSSPGAVRWRAIQARRVPARLGRRGRHRPGPLGGDKVLVAHRLVGSGEFEHPVEDHPAAPGASAVEAEHELIQVAAQVGGLHRSLVGAQQPPLGQ